jgi:hypothetical protein
VVLGGASPAQVNATCSVLSLNLNCRTRQGLIEKAPGLRALINRLPEGAPDIIMLQEAGLGGGAGDVPRALEVAFPGYRAFSLTSEREGKNVIPFNVSLVTLVADGLLGALGTVAESPTTAALAVRVGGFLAINTYWPSGLDGTSVQAVTLGGGVPPKTKHVLDTIDWIADAINSSSASAWVVGGDFNETMVNSDRVSCAVSSTLNRGTFLASLIDRVDAVDAGVAVGNVAHTFFSHVRPPGVQALHRSSSRLDRFLVSQSVAGQMLHHQVIQTGKLSDHRAIVFSAAGIPITRTGKEKLAWRQKKFIVPEWEGDGMRRLLAHHAANSFFDHNFAEMKKRLEGTQDETDLEDCSIALFEAIRASAAVAFRQTNPSRPRRPGRSRRYNDLIKVKGEVVSLKHDLLTQGSSRPVGDVLQGRVNALAVRLTRSGLLDPRLTVPSLGTLPVGIGRHEDWVANWTQAHLHLIRKLATRELAINRVSWDSYTRTAEGLMTFAAKFAKPKRPPPVSSVPHPDTGTPTSDPEIIGRVLLDRVTEPMRTPVRGPRMRDPSGPGSIPGFPAGWKRHYAPSNVGPDGCWKGLMAPPTWMELRTILGKAKKHTSPGEGGLGVDVLQCMVGWELPFHATTSVPPGPVASALLAFLEAVLRIGVYPRHLCVAWVTTIPKGTADPLDVRPISVLPELYRLVSRLLNFRLTSKFLEHSILHPAQRAALANGDFYQAVDTTCNVIEDARERKENTLAFVLYDQSKAFDLVHARALERAMRRIGLPSAFIQLVLSAMDRARSKVRSRAGISEGVSLLRSLRQGDPLASIMYCIYIDPLHWALQDAGGYVMKNGARVASLAFMDDTNVMANDFTHLQQLHELVVEFSLINDARVNAKKTYFFLADHRGESETRHLVSDGGQLIRPVPPGTTARYLGVWLNLEGDWDKMHRLLRKKFWHLFYVIKNNGMTCRAAVMIVNIFLVPAIQRMLRLGCFADNPQRVDSLESMGKALNVLVAKLNGLPLPRSWGGAITPLLFGFKDLAQHAVTLNMELLHLNLNYDPANFLVAATTHDRLASFCQLGGPPVEVVSPSSLLGPALSKLREGLAWGRGLPPAPSTNVTARRLALAFRHGLTLVYNERHLASAHMEARVSDEADVAQEGEGDTRLGVELWDQLEDRGGTRRGLYAEIDPYNWDWMDLIRAAPTRGVKHLVVYTDGSSKDGEDSGAAALWYIPGDEDAGGVILARLRPTPKNYQAECVACALALHFSPINWSLTIVCDCKAALYTVTKPSCRVPWRRRVTAPARPVLECNRSMLRAREAPTHWMKIKSHTHAKDIDSKGNAKVDVFAKLAREASRSGAARRFWWLGAEPAVLCTWNRDPTTTTAWDRWRPSQLMGGVRSHLDRLEAKRLVDKVRKSKSMGKAFIYNSQETLVTARQLARATGSSLHALLAMALAGFLPLRNRRSFAATAHPILPRCDWCATGLKQSSAHVFNCPALAGFAFEGFEIMEQQLAGVFTVASGGSPRVSRVGALRDRLIAQADGFWTMGDWLLACDGVMLSRAQLRLVPHALGRLARQWAENWRVREPYLSLPVTGCLAHSWSSWLKGQKALMSMFRGTPPSQRSSSPHPRLLHDLTKLHSPFWAVVLDGPAWVAPPSNVTWYSSSKLLADLGWWTRTLPEDGAALRLFEWAPESSRAALQIRAKWWYKALCSSQSTVIAAVVPDREWLDDLLSDCSPFALAVGVKVEHWSCGWEVPWALRKVGSSDVKVVLLTSKLADGTLGVRKEAEDLLLALVSCVGKNHREGMVVFPFDSPQGALPPANWWWGPTTPEFPNGGDAGLRVTSGASPIVECRGGTDCDRVCGALGACVEVNTYFGNLGVPPVEVTRELVDTGLHSMEEKDPPLWRRSCWMRLQGLLAGRTAKVWWPRGVPGKRQRGRKTASPRVSKGLEVPKLGKFPEVTEVSRISVANVAGVSGPEGSVAGGWDVT